VLFQGKGGKESTVKPCQMLDPIKQAKYPAITAEEEKISIPLQTLCQVRPLPLHRVLSPTPLPTHARRFSPHLRETASCVVRATALDDGERD
jgi:hypothetical protein